MHFTLLRIVVCCLLIVASLVLGAWYVVHLKFDLAGTWFVGLNFLAVLLKPYPDAIKKLTDTRRQ